MTANPAPEKSLSQNEKILAYLQAGNSLTPIPALELFGCWALSSRISDLNKKGHNIKSELITLDNGKKVSRYWIEAVAILQVEKPLNELFV